jgi:16S rRNA U516 pseudouridylate synthase RsuA-like enzyme
VPDRHDPPGDLHRRHRDRFRLRLKAGVRLNKYISETGICSRREADAWIAAGRVRVNGASRRLGTQVPRATASKSTASRSPRSAATPSTSRSTSRSASPARPSGTSPATSSTTSGHPQRIFPIGRLDKDSEGLILLTNNGDIVNEILREENAHEKEYVVTVDRRSPTNSCAAWRTASTSSARAPSPARCGASAGTCSASSSRRA